MKTRELTSLRKKSPDEIKSLLEQKKFEAVESFAKMKAGQEKNLKKTKNLKREIAQIMTVFQEYNLSKKLDEKSNKGK